MNHCIDCGAQVPRQTYSCEEAGCGDTCSSPLRQMKRYLIQETGIHGFEIEATMAKVAALCQASKEEVALDAIKMADELESECGKDGDKGTKQWMAFKGFRNTLRDKYLQNEHRNI